MSPRPDSSVSTRLFAVPEPAPAPVRLREVEEPLDAPTAADVKTALRRRHPGDTHGSMPGQWTCIEEWLGIDLLALNAWSAADVIGYEVKISRSDLRRELLKPEKRHDARERTTEFYFAVPAGMLTPEEIAYEEPEWDLLADFDRETCPGVPEFGPEVGRVGHLRYGGQCRRNRIQRANVVRVPRGGNVEVVPDWFRRGRDLSEEELATLWVNERGGGRYYAYDDPEAACWNCRGKGHLEKSRVEREAPTCWVPRDVGLVTISKNGCKVVKKSPRRKDPKPIAASRKHMNDLVRWVSHRPDPRHRLDGAR